MTAYAEVISRPCHLSGCTEYGRTNHHHWLYGHEQTTACHCRNGAPR